MTLHHARNKSFLNKNKVGGHHVPGDRISNRTPQGYSDETTPTDPANGANRVQCEKRRVLMLQLDD